MSSSLNLAPLHEIASRQLVADFPLRSWQNRYAWWLQGSDAVVIALSVFASQLLRFGYSDDAPMLANSLVSTAIAIGWIAALAIFRTRADRVVGTGSEEYRRVWTATMFTFLCIAVLSSVFKLDIARGYLAIALPIGLVGLTVNRHLARRGIAAQRRQGRFCNRVLAVGQPSAVERFAGSLASNAGHGYIVVGSCATAVARNLSSGSNEIGTAIRSSAADTVAVVSGDLTSDELRDLSWELKGLDVDLVVSPGVIDVAAPRLAFRANGGLPLIHVDKPQYEGAKRFEKRAFDVGFALVALTVSAPLLAIAALAVRLTSPGPVFYRSVRIGLDGAPFQMIKFRSMVIDADKMVADLAHLDDGNGVLFKMHEDPRITPVGRVLRRFSIDELPQFINVLLGDMSVVGPRPPLPREVEGYDENVRRRLLVRPGITGLWQVSGRSDLSWEDSVRLDLSYVENWSMMADLAISASTLRAVLTGNGAY